MYVEIEWLTAVAADAELPVADAKAKLAGDITETVLNATFANYGKTLHPICAGAVLHQNWIVTSAFCAQRIVNNSYTPYVKMYANRRYMNTSVTGEAFIEFRLINGEDSIKIHPLYDTISRRNDLALINVKPYTNRGIYIRKLRKARYVFSKIEKIINSDKYTPAFDVFLQTGGWGVTSPEVTDFETFGEEKFFLMRNAVPPEFKGLDSKVATLNSGCDQLGWTPAANYDENDQSQICTCKFGALRLQRFLGIARESNYSSLSARFSLIYVSNFYSLWV